MPPLPDAIPDSTPVVLLIIFGGLCLHVALRLWIRWRRARRQGETTGHAPAASRLSYHEQVFQHEQQQLESVRSYYVERIDLLSTLMMRTDDTETYESARSMLYSYTEGLIGISERTRQLRAIMLVNQEADL